MKGILVLSAILLLNVVSAASIQVNSISYSKNPYGYKEFLATGDKINANIVVTDNFGLGDLRRVYVSWDNSWVDCNKKARIDKNSSNYLCILTVTPTMSGLKSVYIKTDARKDTNAVLKLGDFDFKGKPFPVFGNCIRTGTKLVCRSR